MLFRSLTRSLKIQMREERRSLQLPSTRDDDQLIEKTEAGALDLTMTSDEDAGMWEKLKFNWPWQEQTPESTTKTIKRELKEVQSQLADRRKQVAELESRAAELIERLATEARSLTPREAVVKEPETGSPPADEAGTGSTGTLDLFGRHCLAAATLRREEVPPSATPSEPLPAGT